MTSAAFHAAAQAALLPYQIAAAAQVTLTIESVLGVGESLWTVIDTDETTDAADWVIDQETLSSCRLTAPSGVSNCCCIVQLMVNGGTAQNAYGVLEQSADMVKTLKIWIGPNIVLAHNEQHEQDLTKGWTVAVNPVLRGTYPKSDAHEFRDAAGTTYAKLDLSSTDIELYMYNECTSFNIGWEQASAGTGNDINIRGQQAAAGSVGGKVKCEVGQGGTPGTDLPGSLDFDLGRTVGGTSAKCRFLTDAGGAETERLTVECITGGVRIWDTNDALDIYGNALQLRSGATIWLAATSWVVLTGRWNDNNFVTPAQWTANQDNFALTTGKGIYRASTDASRDLTGIVAPAFVGDRIRLFNVGAFDIVLKHESASSTAANRFTLPGAADVTIGAGHCAVIWYDGTSSRWRLESRT